MFEIEDALRGLVASGGSDLHVRAFTAPHMRLNGELVALPGFSRALDPEDIEAAIGRLLTDEQKRAELESEHEVDFAVAVSGLARFRINAFQQRGTLAIVARAIPFEIPSLAELGLPPVMGDIADEERGIILVTGTTGSGKSTTLAAILDQINRRYNRHVVTIEDPIEFLHKDRRSLINQREVGMDTVSFSSALRRVLRQDPDVILIGEMRDEETVRTALSAAETGHLVLSTLHTLDATETINRILDFFPPAQQRQARIMLAGTLKATISQRLVRSTDGGRVPACEVLRLTGRVRDLIMDSDRTHLLQEVIAQGSYYGMQSFDQALYEHVKTGRVDVEEAMRMATSPNDFQLFVATAGRRGTTMDDVADAHERATRPSDGASPGRETSTAKVLGFPPVAPLAASRPPGLRAI